MARLDIGLEVVPKRAFAWAVDCPGWCRSGKTPELAREALILAAPRYAIVAKAAGLDLPAVTDADLRVIDEIKGSGGTEFGVPSHITDADRRPTTTKQAERLAALVAAAWEAFDDTAARSPEHLRKGPRGGGRDRDKMIDHVIGADHGYARELGIRLPEGSRTDRAAVEAERAAVLELLGQRSDGSPIADRKWTPHYAARRIAWHALDHAWEMEDKSDLDGS